MEARVDVQVLLWEVLDIGWSLVSRLSLFPVSHILLVMQRVGAPLLDLLYQDELLLNDLSELAQGNDTKAIFRILAQVIEPFHVDLKLQNLVSPGKYRELDRVEGDGRRVASPFLVDVIS